MNDYERRYITALALLLSVGIPRSKAEPPINKWLRKIGLRPKIPHFLTFWEMFFKTLIWTSLGLAFLQYVFSQLLNIMLPGAFLLIGVLLVVVSPFYHLYLRKYYNLYTWDEL